MIGVGWLGLMIQKGSCTTKQKGSQPCAEQKSNMSQDKVRQSLLKIIESADAASVLETQKGKKSESHLYFRSRVLLTIVVWCMFLSGIQKLAKTRMTAQALDLGALVSKCLESCLGKQMITTPCHFLDVICCVGSLQRTC